MSFYDYREPIEYVVDRYFEKKRSIDLNTIDNNSVTQVGGIASDDTLPKTPCYLIRNEEEQVIKIIYGDYEVLQSETEEEFDPVIWQEELIRDNGRVEGIITTYPDGETVTHLFERDSKGRIERVMITP